MPEWIVVVIAIVAAGAAGAGLTALGVWLLPVLRNRRQGYPFESQIEIALLPLIYEAICSGYRVSEWAMDELQVRMHNADKKVIADTMYDLLPDYVAGWPVYVIKRLISRDRFRELVQKTFDNFDARFVASENRFRELFEEWRSAYDTE